MVKSRGQASCFLDEKPCSKLYENTTTWQQHTPKQVFVLCIEPQSVRKRRGGKAVTRQLIKPDHSNLSSVSKAFDFPEIKFSFSFCREPKRSWFMWNPDMKSIFFGFGPGRYTYFFFSFFFFRFCRTNVYSEYKGHWLCTSTLDCRTGNKFCQWMKQAKIKGKTEGDWRRLQKEFECV